MFAPTDEAFAKLPPGQLEALLHHYPTALKTLARVEQEKQAAAGGLTQGLKDAVASRETLASLMMGELDWDDIAFIRDREASNFCNWFAFRVMGEDNSAELNKAKSKLDALFGGGSAKPASGAPTAATSPEDAARARLEALFKK